MIDIILFQPEIPQNTGNIGRLCAFIDARLHLIHPLGFKINDKNLRRAGMDYWKSLQVLEYENWEEFIISPLKPARIFLLSTHATQSIWEAKFEKGDGLLFGNEGGGAPKKVHEWVHGNRLTIPKYAKELRSLNLAVSVGIAAYEAIRQISLPK
jgi:tRNA (cytidine/uridine-2'-O-)-methyltransferase